MPILSYGRYFVRLRGVHSATETEGLPDFHYYPPLALVYLLAAAIMLTAVGKVAWTDRAYGVGRFWILLVGAAALSLGAAAEFGSVSIRLQGIAYTTSLPLVILTAAFLAWRLFRLENRFVATLLAYASTVAVIVVSLISHLSPGTPFLLMALGIFIWAFFGFLPVAILRLTADVGVFERNRVRLGVIFGLLAVVSILLYKPIGVALLASLSAYLFLTLSVFCFLVKYNRWARETAVGEMFRRRKT